MKENLVYVVHILYQDEAQCTHSYMYGVYSSREIAKSIRDNLIAIGNELVSVMECKVDYKLSDKKCEKTSEFTKKDIKLGMVLKLRNGELGMVIKYHKLSYDWILMGDGELLLMGGDLDNNLLNSKSSNHENPSGWDVVAVYESPYASMTDFSNLNLIWERQSVKEHTIDELYEIVGYKFDLKE